MLKRRLFGIDCRLSLWFPATAIVMLTVDDTPLSSWCLLAALIHELGHFSVMAAAGERPARIVCGVFGVRVERSPEWCVGYIKTAMVSLGGPLANLLCAAVLHLSGANTLNTAVHLLVGSFHLLPIVSLDGGEAIYALLCLRFGVQTAYRTMRIVSCVILVPLTLLGIGVFLYGGYNLSLLILCGYLISLLIFRDNR